MTEILRKAVAGSGRSLAELSRQCGVNRSQLSRFARGERELSLASAEKLLDHFGYRLVRRRAAPDRRGRR